jgi:hypothetical protein
MAMLRSPNNLYLCSPPTDARAALVDTENQHSKFFRKTFNYSESQIKLEDNEARTQNNLVKLSLQPSCFEASQTYNPF